MTPPVHPLVHLERLRGAISKLPDSLDKEDALQSLDALEPILRSLKAHREINWQSALVWGGLALFYGALLLMSRSCGLMQEFH